MSDRRIVERLRQWPLSEKLAIEAADRIEALENALEAVQSEVLLTGHLAELVDAALAPEQDKQADDELDARIEEMKRGHGVE